MTPQDHERTISELESSLDRLQAMYNQYFMGIERIEPVRDKKTVETLLKVLRREQINNTALRFRFQTQVQKFNTLSQYWRRICRQIEEGTYKRDVMRAQRRTEYHKQDNQTPEKKDQPSVFELDENLLSDDAPPVDLNKLAMDAASPIAELDDPFFDGAKRKPVKGAPEIDPELKAFFSGAANVPPPPPGSSPASEKTTPPALKGQPSRQQPPPPPPPPPNREVTRTGTTRTLTDDRIEKIYRAYLIAKQRCREKTDNVSADKVAKLLRKQYLDSKGNVDFKVVIRGGKAMIKSVKKN